MPAMRQVKVRLCILMFLQFFVWGSWYVTAGTYLMQGLGFSGTEVGLIYGSSAVAAAISPFLIGMLADKYFPLVRILFILQISGAILLFLLTRLQQFAIFYPVMLVYMLIFIPSFSLTNSICFYHLKDTKAEFPKIRVWGTIAWISAGLLVGFLKIEDQSTPMLIAAFCSLILAAYSLTLPVTRPPLTGVQSFRDVLKSDQFNNLIRDKAFRVLMIALALICIPAAYYYSFLNPFLNEVGVSNAAGKMALGQITEIVLMLALPFLFRVCTLKLVVFIGLFTWGLRYLLLSLGVALNSEWLYMLCIALHGVAYVMSILSAQIVLDIRIPSELRSTAQGFFSFLTLGLGAFIGSFLAGQTVSLFETSAHAHDWFWIWLLPGIFGIMVSFYFVTNYKSIRLKE